MMHRVTFIPHKYRIVRRVAEEIKWRWYSQSWWKHDFIMIVFKILENKTMNWSFLQQTFPKIFFSVCVAKWNERVWKVIEESLPWGDITFEGDSKAISNNLIMTSQCLLCHYIVWDETFILSYAESYKMESIGGKKEKLIGGSSQLEVS